MENSVMVDRLVALARTDYDAMSAYEEAMKRLDKDDADIRDQFMLFRNDHALHVSVLTTAIADGGWEVPALASKEQNAAGETPLKGAQGTPDVLLAMLDYEKMVRRIYADAVADPFFGRYPADLQEHIRNNLADQEHHVDYIAAALDLLAVTAE